MKVKILKPISSGKGKSRRPDLPSYYKKGEVIDFEKDICWQENRDIKAEAKELEEAGYIKVLKDEKKPAPKKTVSKSKDPFRKAGK